MEETLAGIRETPWDERAFGIPTYEILELTRERLEAVSNWRGHFTVKVDPRADKKLLQEYGFYYCDTLLVPAATREQFVPHERSGVALAEDVPLEDLLAIADGAFVYGRFHRDFRLPRIWAERRYARWLSDLYRRGNVWGLLYEGELVGFFAREGDNIVLHAVHPAFRGRGLAKYLWSRAIQRMFGEGWEEVRSSISAANLPVLNLYASLGFRFRQALDVYHKYQE